MTESKLETIFRNAWHVSANLSPGNVSAFDFTDPVSEHRFHDQRRWRFDFAWPALRVAVECEGGIYRPGKMQGRGRHLTSKGFQGDVEKYNAAASLGWLVLRFTSRDLKRDPIGCIDQVVQTLELRMKGMDFE